MGSPVTNDDGYDEGGNPKSICVWGLHQPKWLICGLLSWKGGKQGDKMSSSRTLDSDANGGAASLS
ncbi:protein FAR-RED ELONGATED HYPOCOTYL 3-like [Pyrus ussuriensis x Pyrus communis]|uniref:Protein FAR-RED ELONGATED HYPOCOTYL 3-like n=1 Tax=Pyrus ussuriensis x Pyrus communis TaxID=2448454 RepID=A0A5N5FB53_9ROSA|nr:protein FAR-RED ELONGATED HYPOCOTYL 3-like [Pyrus ussuriensis x Pyrus communis]